MTEDKKDDTVTLSGINYPNKEDLDLDLVSGAYKGFEGGFGVGGNDSNITTTITVNPDELTTSTLGDTVTFNDGQADLTLTIPRDGNIDLHGGFTTAPISTHSTDVITVTNEDLGMGVPTDGANLSLLCEELTTENHISGQQLDLFDDLDKKD
jgi:hypothetical protein